MKIAVGCMVAFLVTLLSFGQGSLQFDRLEKVRGLENRSVTSIVQDDLGFLWFGTPDGLIRYDGYEIKIYKNNLKDKNSLGDNNIRALAKDAQGNLWIATQGGGLDKFNLRLEQFTHYRNNPSDPGSISGNAVWSVLVDKKGRVWAGTWSNGLNVFHPNTNKFTRIPESNYVPVMTIAEDPSGNIWFSSSGINRVNPGDFTFQTFPFTSKEGLLNLSARALLADESGVWAGTENDGLFIFNEVSRTMDLHSRHEAMQNNAIFSLFKTSDKQIWAGGNSGLTIFSGTEIQSYRNDPADRYSLSTNAIRTIYQDRTGNVWVGTEGGGINRVLAKKNFKLFRHSEKPGSLSHNLIRSLFEDSRGRIWVGTQGGGLNILNMETDQFKTVPIPSKEISSIYEDADGIFWIGSWGGGLFKYDERAGAITNFVSSNDENSLPDDRIQVVYRDRQGVLWVGTENGLAQFNTERQEWVQVKPPHFPQALIGTNPQGQAFLEATDGTIWTGTWFGLNKISPDRKEVVHYTADTAAVHALSSDHVISLALDEKNKVIWIGTFGGGLNRMDLATNEIVHFTESEGLPNSTIFGIRIDGNGNLWLSTNNGLSRFNPATRIFRNYDATEGLQGNEFYWGAACKTKSGKLLFGGINGLTYFDPAEISDNSSIPPVVITNFEIFNKPVTVKRESILKEAINFTKELRLRYNQNVVSFQYAALNFNSPEKNLYAYQLENFDKQWNYVGDKRNISYTNLSPGEYTLRIKGSNNDGVWSDKGVELKIVVVPPFWSTWWFYSLAIGTVVALVYMLIKIRLRSVRKDKEAIEKKLKEELDKAHAALDTEKKAVAEEQEKNKERNWIDQSLSIISEVLSRSKNNVDELCKDVVSVLVKRCGVVAGAIYLYDEQTDELVKCANFGFNTVRHTISKGVGLIGESFSKRQTIQLDNLPDEYYKISSGLGEAQPKVMVLVPLQFEGFCAGVVELASFTEIPSYQIQFIEIFSAQVTATIQTTQISQKTALLLEESKQQAEEMKIREEELKQNLEEMHSIQEDFSRKTNEYERTIARLQRELDSLKSK